MLIMHVGLLYTKMTVEKDKVDSLNTDEYYSKCHRKGIIKQGI